MFEDIAERLSRAEDALGSELALEIAPVYLLPKTVGSEQYIEFSLENLLLGLENNGVVFDKSNVLIPLSIERDPSGGGKTGFCTQAGVFKPTLERWILYYKIEYHTYQGIIMLDIRDCKDFLRNDQLVDNLTKQIMSNKKRFLFFVLFDEDDLDEVKKRFGEMLFTCTAPMPELSVDDYLCWFYAVFQRCGMRFDESAKTLLTELFDKHFEELSFRTLSLWMKQILWECASAKSFDTTVGADSISEESLTEFIRNSDPDGQNVKLGFN